MSEDMDPIGLEELSAYLDDELAGEERRELETHIIDCASCRQHLESERADLELVRASLVAPPAVSRRIAPEEVV